jgi:AraC family transcriptional regulator
MIGTAANRVAYKRPAQSTIGCWLYFFASSATLNSVTPLTFLQLNGTARIMGTFEAITNPRPTALSDGVNTRRAPSVEYLAYTGWRSTRAGIVKLDAAPEHRIRIHAGGAPVTGHCGHEDFIYTRGDMDIMPAGHTDTWREDTDNVSLYLAVTPRLLQRTAADLGINPVHSNLDLRHQFRDDHIEHIAWALDAERRSGYANGNLYMESLGTALAVHLLQRYPAAPLPRAGGLAPLRLQRLKDYIEQNLDQPLTLTELGAVAGISGSHLKTQFRRSTGMPVHQYVIHRRVERARELLLRSDLPISQIAFDAGFAHQSHMARHMQRLLGVAPAALRRAHKN